jgi:transposase
MCPGNNESAGKRRSGYTGKGDRWLKGLLTEAAHAASHGKTYLASQYHRLAGRFGKNKAAIAVGHTILIIAYHIIRDRDQRYRDLGYFYFEKRDEDRLRHRLVHRLEGLGYAVSLKPAQPVAFSLSASSVQRVLAGLDDVPRLDPLRAGSPHG